MRFGVVMKPKNALFSIFIQAVHRSPRRIGKEGADMISAKRNRRNLPVRNLPGKSMLAAPSMILA